MVEPVVADWVVDVMMVSYDADTEKFVVRAEEGAGKYDRKTDDQVEVGLDESPEIPDVEERH